MEPQIYDRVGGGKEQIGFVAQDVQASGKLGATMCKTKNLDGRELMALDYQKLSVVLWGVVKKLQRRVEKLEKKKAARVIRTKWKWRRTARWSSSGGWLETL